MAWSPAEQVARFGEFVELLDLLLQQEVTNYQGRFYRCTEAETIPLPVQRPCLPITIARTVRKCCASQRNTPTDGAPGAATE